MRIEFDELLLRPGLENCEEIFFDKQTDLQTMIYTEMDNEAEWDVGKIRELSKAFFKSVSRKNILYALYVREKGKKEWSIKYVGHSAAHIRGKG